jgi:hypothetical protein
MSVATRTNKSLSLEKRVVEEIERTKGRASSSERVNALLKRALELERLESLENEAEIFFAAVSQEEQESSEAFQAVALKSLSRED